MTREEEFLGLRVAGVTDRRVLLLQPVHRCADLVLVAAALWFDGVGQHGFRKRHGPEGERIGLVAEGIAGQRVFEFGDRTEVAGLDLGYGGLGLALQQLQMPKSFGHVSGSVLYRRIGLECPGDDTKQRDTARERVGNRLPHERRSLGFVVGRAGHLGAVLVGPYKRPVSGRREIREHRVEELRDADILER